MLYLLQTVVKNSGLTQVLIETYFECNFSSCSSIFREAESTAFAARTVIVSLNKQNSFSDRFITCLPQKYFLQWASQKTARNQNIKGVFNCRIWDSTAGMVFDKTIFSTHIVTSKKSAWMHEMKRLCSLEELDFICFLSIFSFN